MPQAKVVLLDAWPQPSSSPEPAVFATDSTLLLRYIASEEQVAIIKFPLVKSFQLGAPNDEALGGHPLAELGLKYYSVHCIENSPWIAELERRNSVHPRHNTEAFLANLCHYIFTFQDSTLECIISQGQWHQPVIELVASAEEAKAIWSRLIAEAHT
jgi:hypothetical protein